jgi:histone demethylase JARID1
MVSNVQETIEVDYGADIHSTTHGSGFPTVETNPTDPYSTDPWNLNVMPLDNNSLFRHIKSDVSGMTVPWLYVGMMFSTFCWHNEDHYCYSINYQHFGATKTWYGIPGSDADKFELAMKNAVPELFETQPDLLFQLVTMLSPERLVEEGVNVYAVDQRPNQFVITFPQAYHAGFNHGV